MAQLLQTHATKTARDEEAFSLCELRQHGRNSPKEYIANARGGNEGEARRRHAAQAWQTGKETGSAWEQLSKKDCRNTRS